MNCSSVNSIQRIARATGSRFCDSSVYGYRAGSTSSTTHTSISAHRATQTTPQRTTRGRSSSSCAQQRERSRPDPTFPCTPLTRCHLQISLGLLSFHETCSHLTITRLPDLRRWPGLASPFTAAVASGPLVSRRRNCLLPREALLGFPVAWNRTAALWPGLSFKNNSYTTANYHEANKQVIQTSKIVKELVSCCFSSTEIKSCYSGFIPVIFEASFSLRFPNPFIELRAEFLFPKFHINMTTLEQTRIVYLKAGKHFADERQTL